MPTDKKRLDWIKNRKKSLLYKVYCCSEWWTVKGSKITRGDMREAIDYAMKAEDK